MFLFGKKEAKVVRGVDLINMVSDQFGTMINDLEQGSCDCEFDCAEIQEQMSALTTRHSFLEKSANRAAKIMGRLKELIGE